MAHPVTHFEVLGKDAKKLQDFYSSAFGWKIDASNPMNYGIIEAEGIRKGSTKNERSIRTMKKTGKNERA